MDFETLEQLRDELRAYVDRYHDRPHSGLDYRTPKEVRQTWDGAQEQPLKLAA
jgi:putative transposase